MYKLVKDDVLLVESNQDLTAILPLMLFFENENTERWNCPEDFDPFDEDVVCEYLICTEAKVTVNGERWAVTNSGSILPIDFRCFKCNRDLISMYFCENASRVSGWYSVGLIDLGDNLYCFRINEDEFGTRFIFGHFENSTEAVENWMKLVRDEYHFFWDENAVYNPFNRCLLDYLNSKHSELTYWGLDPLSVHNTEKWAKILQSRAWTPASPTSEWVIKADKQYLNVESLKALIHD
jgi:hypothetical protein